MRLATKRYIKPETYSHTELSLEHFPSLPIHSNLSNFKNDDTADDTTEDDCNKDYPKAPKTTTDTKSVKDILKFKILTCICLGILP